MASGVLNSFALILGHCAYIPPSGRAALAIVGYFFGAVPGYSVADYHAALTEQLVAAGETAAQAAKEVAWLDRCAASYVVPPWARSH